MPLLLGGKVGRTRIRMDKTGQFRAPTLSRAQLKFIGQQMVIGQKQRWSKAINASGAKAKALAARTIKSKIAYGKQPIRNMEMTGLVLRNFQLRKWQMEEIRAENTAHAARRHAVKAQRAERMIGLSPQESEAIWRNVYRAYQQYAKFKAWYATTGRR
jgi:hypothetical protein